MKILATIFLIALMTLGCKEVGNESDTAFAKAKQGNVATSLDQELYTSYGAKITTENVLTNSEIADTYAALKKGDTAMVKFTAPINTVCKSKGCWMRLELPEDQEVFVKFKDYGFFVPLDAQGETIVQGKAYLEEVAVDELRHMAEDAGKSKEEIAAITTSERELRFMADGVLIKSK